MMESLMLGALGGIVGSVIGLALVWFRNFAILPENLQVESSTILSSFLWPLVPIAILLAIVLAGIAGFIPSRRGATMDPEEALYYEW
jgi:putative ABC transport system permease protein